MPTQISNKGLLDKCKRFVLTDTNRTDKDKLIRDALITSNREIANIGAEPLAWNREVYDEIFTRYYATASAITNASTGVITCDSVDPDLTSDHGFQTNDIVYIRGINGTERLNDRLFRAVRASATTMTLKTLDGQTAIDTTNYETYSSGGTIYHAGIVLPASTIEPSGGTASYEWDIKRVFDVQFDLQPGCNPITEEAAKEWLAPGSRPVKWRYQQYAFASFGTVEHLLFWYNFPSQKYNIRVSLEKAYPDLSSWTASVYPPAPAQIHDYIWHRALSNLATQSETARRMAKDGADNTKMEIVNANYWIAKAAQEEVEIMEYSRMLSGGQPYMSQGMSA